MIEARRWVSPLAALAFVVSSGVVSSAPAKTFADNVAEAKRAILLSADDAFTKTWEEQQADAARLGITASEARAMARWGMIGARIGTCYRYASPTDEANWRTKFDDLALQFGLAGSPRRESWQQTGVGVFNGSKDTLGPLDLSDDQKHRLCTIDLQAARELLAEM